MNGLHRKFLSVALVAALVFCAFPVSTGVPVLDRGRYEQAHAIASAVPIIIATACAAYGVCIAGTSTTMYDANLNSVYSGLKNETGYWSSSWAQYCQDKGGFDNAMQSAVNIDGQSINLGVLKDAGFFDSVNLYTAYLVENGQGILGSSSSAAEREGFWFGDYLWESEKLRETELRFLEQIDYETEGLYAFKCVENSNYVTYTFCYAKSNSFSFSVQDGFGVLRTYQCEGKDVVIQYNISRDSYIVNNNWWSTNGSSAYAKSGFVLLEGYEFVLRNGSVVDEETQALPGVEAVVSPAVDATSSEITPVVWPISPTSAAITSAEE